MDSIKSVHKIPEGLENLKELLHVEDYLEKRDQYYLVDVRSPGEFGESCIPGAVNVPLFTDEERALVGTTYWKEGTDRAKLVGLSLVAKRLPQMVESILNGAAGKEIVLYCWRGGMRSRSVYTLLASLGYPARQLVGGYKSFRRYVVKFLNETRISAPVYVLNGLTGVGKTLVIKELQQTGAPVLDLEEMANHRGSAFGSVGLGDPRSQKDFEALLVLALRGYQDVPFLVVEGEGKRVGPVLLPDFLYDAMQNGRHILLEASLDTRVERIVAEYKGTDNTEALASAVLSLQKKLGKEACDALAAGIRAHDYKKAARTLCANYYDLYYRDSRQGKGHYLAVVNVDDLKQGADAVMDVVRRDMEGAVARGAV